MTRAAARDADLAGRIALRASTAADEQFLTRVFASTRQSELALLGWSEAQPTAFSESQSSFQRRAYAAHFPRSAFEIVTVDGSPAGRLFVAREEGELRIVDIALLPKYRGVGIGTQLVRAVLGEAAGLGIGVGLRVDAQSPARRLYARLGFVVEATAESQIALRWTPAGSPTGGPSG